MKYILIILFFVFYIPTLDAQVQSDKVIQFTGVVFESDSVSIVHGTHVYVPKHGRGTTANSYGFFSLPVLEGDSVVFSAVGFKRAYFIIPEHDHESSLRVIISLQEDIQFLKEVEILPYPTESMFKEAIISMELPYQKEYANIYQWLNSQEMKDSYLNLPMSLNANHQQYMQLHRQSYINRYAPRINPLQSVLLNPFAWKNFLDVVLKKKK